MDILPITNVAPLISKNDVWMLWLTDPDQNYEISEFQIYDLSVVDSDDDIELPFEHTKRYRTFSYIDKRLKGIPYQDWGANCPRWEKVHLADVFFKFAMQYGFKDKDAIKQFLNQLSLIKEWRKDILIYMSSIGMDPFYEDYD